MTYLKFIINNARFLLFGFILILFSAFGQTYFLSLFNGAIQQATQLSNGQIGLVYSLATLGSAGLISFLGGKIDSIPLPRFTLLVCLGLVIACASMAATSNIMMLFVSYLLLRFFGQGMMCHVSMVSMARYFEDERGRAISLAALGYPLGEGLFPILGVLVLGYLGFIGSWALFALIAALGITPLLLWLLKGHHKRQQAYEDKQQQTDDSASYTNKFLIFKDWRFYCVTFGVLATGFINTGIFFQHNALIQARDWSNHLYASSFTGYALGNVLGSLLFGFLTDRFKASRLIAFYLAPMLLGLLGLMMIRSGWSLYGFMLGAGLSQGASSILVAAIWVELYGSKLLGSIRSWVVALKVFFTALSPVLFGYLIDWQVDFNYILLICLGYCLISIALLASVQIWNRQK